MKLSEKIIIYTRRGLIGIVIFILVMKGLGFILDSYGKKQKALELETYKKNCIENGGHYKTEKVIDPVGFRPPSDWIEVEGGFYGFCDVHSKQ